ncbi:MAG: lysine-sensitive aspartokinase 3 [Bryobacteraceae bacterium]
MKFGGSSVESAAAIDKVAEIVRARLDRHPIVVVSAMGKTTNRLLSIAAAAVRGDRDQALGELASLQAFHLAEADGLGLEAFLEAQFQELSELVKGLAIMGELTPRATDAISSYGERLSSVIVSAVFLDKGITARHIDARTLIVTDSRHTQAAPLFAETYDRCARAITADFVWVMGGFIGSTADGVTSTLGRGGSDYTAAIVGAGIHAEEIQIWTDVDGMLTCDPRVLEGGRRIKACSFAEAAELAYFGAKVLHPATVVPAMERNIPVRILNSRRPNVEGTRIVAEPVTCRNVAKAIACKRDITLVNIVSTRMLMAHGFLRRIFEVFDRYETPVDMVATTEVSVSLTIDNTAQLDKITAELREFAEVVAEDNQAIVSLVGDSLRHTPGVAGRVFGALDSRNIKMVSQGASQLNISFVVDGADLVPVVRSLHQEFFGNLDSAVFDTEAA